MIVYIMQLVFRLLFETIFIQQYDFCLKKLFMRNSDDDQTSHTTSIVTSESTTSTPFSSTSTSTIFSSASSTSQITSSTKSSAKTESILNVSFSIASYFGASPYQHVSSLSISLNIITVSLDLFCNHFIVTCIYVNQAVKWSWYDCLFSCNCDMKL